MEETAQGEESAISIDATGDEATEAVQLPAPDPEQAQGQEAAPMSPEAAGKPLSEDETTGHQAVDEPLHSLQDGGKHLETLLQTVTAE